MSATHLYSRSPFWTHQSNGTNTPTLLQLVWLSWNEGSIYEASNPAERHKTLGNKFQGTLMGKDVEVKPFIFTTCSLLYALRHAIGTTRGKAQSSAYIVCIDTDTCKRPDGGDARFYTAAQAMWMYGVGTPTARWTYEERGYWDVWVTSYTVVPGKTSYYVSFDTLKDIGLSELYPELGYIAQSANPGLETPVRKLWEHRYSQKRDLPPEEFTLAVKLAAAFKPVRRAVATSSVAAHLLAWFIALKGQQSNGRRLRAWLMAHSCRSAAQTVRLSSLQDLQVPERARYLQILAVLRGHGVRRAKIDGTRVRITRERLELQPGIFMEGKKKAKSGGRCLSSSDAMILTERDHGAGEQADCNTEEALVLMEVDS